MANITKEQFETLSNMHNAFRKELLKKDIDGVQKFSENTGFFEKLGLASAKLRLNFARNSGYETKAVRLVSFFDKAVPGLTRTFGEQALLEALPVEAKTQEVADLTAQLGGHRIAGLIQKTL